MKKLLITLALSCISATCLAESILRKTEIPYLKGELKVVLDASPEGKGRWFTNDHCFIEDDKGTLHWFGINNPFPPAGKSLYRYHPFMGHAICTGDPLKPWKRVDFALDDSKANEYLGAPFIVKIGKEYVMLFESVIDGKRALEIARSKDLYDWKREGKSILTNLAHTKRDPCIIKHNGEFLIYLTNPAGHTSEVVCVKTTDFKKFTPSKIVYSRKDGVSWGGLESPFVHKRKGLYYFFICQAHRHYTETVVIVSDNPYKFEDKNIITTLFSHAPEILQWKGKHYITNCGPEDARILNTHGLEMVELGWLKK